MTPERFDVAVVGSGPAGQEAALQAAEAGRRTLLVERERGVGGSCVHQGTIPSKTLRETAGLFLKLRAAAERLADVPAPETVRVSALMSRVGEVVRGHVEVQERRLRRARVELAHGRASFEAADRLKVLAVDGGTRRVQAPLIVLAVGSRPRSPANVALDHEHVLDSDSFLSMEWLPRSLVVLGGGVIACEYASIFAALGVRVTMVDKGERPLAFLDPELTAHFLRSFADSGGVFLPGAKATSCAWNGVDAVETVLESGEVLRSDKALCALGRVANTERLDLAAAGLAVDARGLLAVDDAFRTAVPGVLAVGDVIGPPSLAATSADQGRRAVRRALGLPPGQPADTVPIGTYTVPDLASVGLDEHEARRRHGGCLVGRARFEETARGLIAGARHGMLKLVAAPDGRRLLGAQAVGDQATELVHIAQMALLAGSDVDVFFDHVFNFPTLAEGYRSAALDIASQRRDAPSPVASPALSDAR
ncbi:MAG TPA: Si-specific NAD(P)(+) transhydrogenase [Planctomycetota bacterium]|nr:Si-specific NAD(P)(+) transhydrogenase [Planctomycetota bacterium]